ncbi:MAG: hypothetical protein ABW173_12955 [Sphingomonas sp.]
MPPSSARLWKPVKRLIHRLHRWTGIALCLLFSVWFVSGVVMMYVPFPSFRAEERVATAAPIDWTRVRVGPGEALARLGGGVFPEEMRLAMTGGEPVYRITGDGGREAVSARTGARAGPVDAAAAMRIAAVHAHAGAASATLIDHDQWVVTRAFARMAPFWRVRIDDAAGADIYVTRAAGEIVQNTDRRERFWNWLGAVPHWFYFSALRTHQEPWRQTVIWASGVGLAGAILGLWIGILRLRVQRRYKSGSVTPYRGWMKWHHLAGLVGGAVLITWVFSGWLSMRPFGGFGDGDADAIARRYAGATRPRFAATGVAGMARSAAGAVELRFLFIGGRPVILAVRADGGMTALDGATAAPMRPDRTAILRLAERAVPAGRLADVRLLTRHDRYWYATGDPRQDARPLPVLRLTFDDPARSWLYVDPDTGRLLAQSSDGRRTYRWLFSALHSFDPPALLAARPLRDGLMIALSLAGLLISVSGVVIGWRRLSAARPRRRAGG